MSNDGRVEELSDSDPDEVDISTVAAQQRSPSNPINPSLMQGAQIPAQRSQQVTRENSKHWQCLYPLYFDSSRKRAEGRRVSTGLAVVNPLAREIVDAVVSLNLQPVLEPEKTHPRDWANPGRVRVLVKEDGKSVSRGVKNKHDLYNKVAQYLKAHPTNEKSPHRLKIVGLPPVDTLKPPSIPRGWKMNTILPLHSPALSGGGVSENIFKDMMAGMQGEQGGSAPQGGKLNKKDKKVKG